MSSILINNKIAVDDTILIKDTLSTAGSKIMDGFKSLFSAEAVERLEAKGYEISERTQTGEFGLDLVGEFSYYAPQSGKLAGAAASLVADGKVKAALGVDMNGAPRRAAALSGTAFIKPTYGTVSRYGVISCAASGEQLGVYAADTDTVAEILGVIAGHDSKDGTSLPAEKYEYAVNADVKGKKVAVVKELLEKANNIVYLEFDEEPYDQYDRLLAYVFVYDFNTEQYILIEDLLLQKGYCKAVKYEPNTKYFDHFKELEAAAKESCAGFFGTGFYE